MAAWQATGARLWHPHSLALLAEAHTWAGKSEEASQELAEALDVIEKTAERLYEAELYRLKGKSVLQSVVHGLQSKLPNPHSPIRIPQSAAEACFLKAIEIARKQQAKSSELRATASLARLWQKQGKVQ